MRKSIFVVFLSSLVVVSATWAEKKPVDRTIDIDRVIVRDMPKEKMVEKFGKIPGEKVLAEDLAAMTAYRFEGDTLRILAILVEWDNRPGTYSAETIDSMIFSRNVWSTGSVADYFNEVSYGQVTVTGDMFGWYNDGTYDIDWDFIALLEELDPVIDYSQYDGDGDGSVDAVCFIRSGNGQEDSGDPDDIWSYALCWPGNGWGPYDGVLVTQLNTVPETRPLHNPDNPAQFSGEDSLNNIRVLCHELGHNLGLPDLYDCDSKLDTVTYFTPFDDNDHPMVDWCLMGYGGYGILSIKSNIPSHLCGWSKQQLGWIEPTVLEGEYQDLVLYNIETRSDSSLYKIEITPYVGEYFLLEYRNPNSAGKFDKIDSDFSCYFWPDLTYGGDPLDRGLLITHVHDSLIDSYSYNINDGTPQYPHYTVYVKDAGYDPYNDLTYNPEGRLTDSAQWWYPYETRRGALFSSDVPGQNEFGPNTVPSSAGHFGSTDIYVRVDSLVDDRLYLYVNTPPIVYEPPIEFAVAVDYATGDSPHSFVAADLDGDGDNDLALANYGGNNVSILKNDGTGSFATPTNYAVGNRPYCVIAADLDGDGDKDLAVTNSYDHNITVLKNDGDGVFASAVNYATGLYPYSVFASDFDGDGDADLAVANFYGYVSILKNNGDGAFSSPINYTVGSGAISVVASDLDGDGYADLAVANNSSDDVSILMNNGNGTFASGVNYSVGNFPRSVFAADLDDDGDNDLAIANSGSYPDHNGSVSILWNNSDGTFAAKVDYQTGGWPQSIIASDLDADGDIDLAVANNNDNVAILKNTGGGTFAFYVKYGVGAGPMSIYAADLDGDGDNDLATANFFDDSVSILINLTLSEPPPVEFAPVFTYPAGEEIYSLVAADFDGDGDRDLAVANYTGNNVSILKNNGTGSFAASINYAVGNKPYCVIAADLDGDGDKDLAVANFYGNNVTVLENDGDGFFAVGVNYAVGVAPRSVFAADMDGDGDIDLAAANFSSDDISVLINNGDGTFAAAVNYAVGGEQPTSVFAVDLDGDGDIDIATANGAYPMNVSILNNYGDGTFSSADNYLAGDGPFSIYSADLDGDGDNDLAVSNEYSNDVSILLNNGDGTFATPVNYAVGHWPWSVYAADLDGDGDNDLAVTNFLSESISILQNNGNGIFAGAVHHGVGDYPSGLFVTDLDGDRDNDLAIANYYYVSILLNLSDVPVLTCVCRGDTDGNGQFDILDADNMIDFLFRGGTALQYQEEVDVDNSGQVDVLDADYMIDHLFRDGPAPVPCP